MRERITTALDVLGLLLVAGGLFAALLPYIGWAALAPAGVLVLGAVRLVDWLATRTRRVPFSRTPTDWLTARGRERAA